MNLIAAVAFTPAASASEWTLIAIATPAPATSIRQAGEAVFFEAGNSYRIVPCVEDRLCFERDRPPIETRAAGGIPGGTITEAPGLGIVRASYGAPTERYPHGVLGDRIEGGAIEVVDDTGRSIRLVLNQQTVFEDIAPRIADIDGDGRNDVVAIRSDVSAGAGLVVYGMEGPALRELASIPPIGQPNRWLNVAGIADFNGDGNIDIALVRTPHIGGRLELWTMSGGALTRMAALDGFSNHVIGSTVLGMSAVADADGDGIPDLALPSADRMTFRIMTARSGAWEEIGRVPTTAPISMAVGVIASNGSPVFVIGTGAGAVFYAARQEP
ncbi:MAG: FG-GAP repeat domain-containing protein [Dehalococcoidia bacterium]